MKVVKCVNCGNEVKVDISSAIDENGEVFVCPNCEQTFRFAEK